MTMHLDFQKQSISLCRREVDLGSDAVADFVRHTPLPVGLEHSRGPQPWPHLTSLLMEDKTTELRIYSQNIFKLNERSKDDVRQGAFAHVNQGPLLFSCG